MCAPARRTNVFLFKKIFIQFCFCCSENIDWGIYTIDTVIDNSDFQKHHFLALTNFGHHALHHLFPTLDHGILPQLYPILFETLNEFKLELSAYPWYRLIQGQFNQLARNKPHPNDPGERLKLKKECIT